MRRIFVACMVTLVAGLVALGGVRVLVVTACIRAITTTRARMMLGDRLQAMRRHQATYSYSLRCLSSTPVHA
jgi:hypothetical protein